ncbi:MAG: hypothetical protein IKV26_07425 [Paludibacteraceae bacterium]|nr:hypothetical protein [Paludibacteraceae bacterium]
MKKIFYLIALAAISLVFIQCEQEDLGNGKLSNAGNHEYVDLGLPSGLLWATCNVGANKPEEYGDYFAWGEVKPKKDYSWKTYKYGKAKDQLTKYCTSSSYGKNGFSDNKGTLDSEDDVATVNWGDKWRMPTKEELEELFNYCTVTYITLNGVNGYKVLGHNGNSIFLPTAGYMDNNTLTANNFDYFGYYWSSSLYKYPYEAFVLLLCESDVSVYTNIRYYGLPVRPVYKIKAGINEDATGVEAGHEYVDLGLSVKWATCNIGATKPEEYGNYFAWGETKTKNIYDWSTYKYYRNGKFTKYCSSEEDALKFADGIYVLESEDDAATVNWGGKWRMPNDSHFAELLANCTLIWTTQNGVSGYKVIGSTRNSIFLPSAGYMDGDVLYNAEEIGYYWTSIKLTFETSYAYCGCIDSSHVASRGRLLRNYGLVVRPICE